MIIVYFNKPDFEYDVHSLVKAFFAKEEVQMFYMFSGEVAKENVACMNKEAHCEDELPLEEAGHLLKVEYSEDMISLCWENLDTHEKEERFARTSLTDKVAAKNVLKQNLYELLCKVCKKELPWGSLTGIRPTKIPM